MLLSFLIVLQYWQLFRTNLVDGGRINIIMHQNFQCVSAHRWPRLQMATSLSTRAVTWWMPRAECDALPATGSRAALSGCAGRTARGVAGTLCASVSKQLQWVINELRAYLARGHRQCGSPVFRGARFNLRRLQTHLWRSTCAAQDALGEHRLVTCGG